MKMKLIGAAIGIFTSGVSLAAQFTCGIWLDDNQDPSTVFAYDTDDSQAVASAGNFFGLVQKQASGDLVAAVATADDTLAAALYPVTADVLTSLLQKSDGTKAMLVCQQGNKRLSRPQQLKLNFK